MSSRWIFAAIGLLATLAGAALWLTHEPPATPQAAATDIGPAALYAATFRDSTGQPVSLGRFEGHVVVLNFWATWCAPCREEMPAFNRLQGAWEARNVRVVGVANDDPGKVAHFAKSLGIAYPLLTGGAEVEELARRLGDPDGLLPFTVVLDPQGRVVEQRVGAYTESLLEPALARATSGKR